LRKRRARPTPPVLEAGMTAEEFIASFKFFDAKPKPMARPKAKKNAKPARR